MRLRVRRNVGFEGLNVTLGTRRRKRECVDMSMRGPWMESAVVNYLHFLDCLARSAGKVLSHTLALQRAGKSSWLFPG